MDIKVTTSYIEIDKESLNRGEYNIRECNFDLPEEFDDLVCKALFTIKETKLTYEVDIVNNKCNIPYEATEHKGNVIIGVIAFETDGNTLVKRYSPSTDEFFVMDGSYVEDIENQSIPTPSELEQLEQRIANIELDTEQVETNTQDIADIKTEQAQQNTNISNLQNNKADKSEIPDVTGFITKDVNDLTNYTLTTQTGSQIELNLNSTNFKMTATLKDKDGNTVDTSNEIDLPLESVVVNASYDSSTKEIVLTLQNGNTVRISIADLVSGLVSDTDYATSDKGGVIKVGENGITLNNNNKLQAGISTYNEYSAKSNYYFIGKGTLENVITGKGLVSDTDYANSSKGGTVKANAGFEVSGSTGLVRATTYTNEQYNNAGDVTFIGKGTLENVITGKQLVNETQLNESQEVQDEDIRNLIDNNMEVTGSGSDITLYGTSKNKFKSINIQGNSEQKQLTGKNLFDSDTILANKTSFVKNGNFYMFYLLPENFKNQIKITALLKGELQSYLTAGFCINPFASGGSAYRVIANGEATSHDSFNFSNAQNVYFFIGNSRQLRDDYEEVDLILNNYQIQVETGTESTDFEPFCGAIPSPNLKYQQLEETVTGNIQLKIQNNDNENQIFPIASGNTKMRSTPDKSIKDVFYGKLNNWFLKQFIGNIILTGSENGWKNDSTNKLCGLEINNIVSVSSTSTVNGYCNSYIAGNLAEARANSYNFCVNVKTLWFNNNGMTLDEFKSWISAHNLIVSYPLETPITTEITDTTVITQLNTIYEKACSYKDMTYVTLTSEGASPIADVTAIADNTHILDDYVKNTDYANSSKGGVVKSNDACATTVGATGNLASATKTYQQYLTAREYMFIGKGTLENVIAGKQLIDKNVFSYDSATNTLTITTS